MPQTKTWSAYERHKLWGLPSAAQILDAARWLRLLADCHERGGEVRAAYERAAELLEFEAERVARG